MCSNQRWEKTAGSNNFQQIEYNLIEGFSIMCSHLPLTVIVSYGTVCKTGILAVPRLMHLLKK